MKANAVAVPQNFCARFAALRPGELKKPLAPGAAARGPAAQGRFCPLIVKCLRCTPAMEAGLRSCEVLSFKGGIEVPPFSA
jgi:hypothetical protein